MGKIQGFLAAVALWLVLLFAFSAMMSPEPQGTTGPPPQSPADRRAAENARLDREIKSALAAGKVYHPPKPVEKSAAASAKRSPALWTVTRTTLACANLADAEAFAFMDALGGAAGMRNPASDPSQTSCRHVRPGDRIARGRPRDGGLVSVVVNEAGNAYMIDGDLVPAK